jgi:imidazolonepropionase-like amidohydrolase
MAIQAAIAIVVVSLIFNSGRGAALGSEHQEKAIAIVGVTVIDGNGGAPLSDATIIVRGKRIVEIGARPSVAVPKGAQVVNASGKFATPGFIDTNVHLSLYNGGEGMIRYEDRLPDLAAEAAQKLLKFGITTARDSYGVLPPLLQVRDAIARGEIIGPRLYVAGNIVGWGGPWSATFSASRPQTFFQERMNDFVTQGSGEELMDMNPEELRVAMDKYLDKGVDFVKYGGTKHVDNTIIFSPRQQEVIVSETHKRGKFAETHSTSPEALRISVLAGIDLIQHPEIHDVPIPDELVQLIVEHHVMCSILEGHAVQKQTDEQKARADIDAKKEEEKNKQGITREKTGWELRTERLSSKKMDALHKANAEKLIKGGCVTTVSTDTYVEEAPDFMREPPKEGYYTIGKGTLSSIEGLVELGMTPSQAIVSATKNGAIAAQGLKDFGTLEAGKYADILLLDEDPLADIKNIRKLNMVMKEGQIVDRDKLPTKPVWDAVKRNWTETKPATKTDSSGKQG